MSIIDNVSYSKEVKGLRQNLGHIDNRHLDAVSDADRIESLGQEGINRCIEYTKVVGGQVPKDVVVHCHDKLLKLLPGGFFKTRRGRQLAIPLHEIVQNYVDGNFSN
jgi:hypothetical protein